MLPVIEPEDGVLQVSGAKRWYYATMELSGGHRFFVTVNYKWIDDAWGIRLWKMVP